MKVVTSFVGTYVDYLAPNKVYDVIRKDGSFVEIETDKAGWKVLIAIPNDYGHKCQHLDCKDVWKVVD